MFGCPGLSRSPSYFILTLLLNVVAAMCFPVTLLFAPMIVMIKNYQGVLLVSDQAERLRTKTTSFIHVNLARVFVLVGFALLGAISGILCAVIGTLVGTVYQLLKIVTIFVKVAFCCEKRLDVMSSSPMPKTPLYNHDNSDNSINSADIRSP